MPEYYYAIAAAIFTGVPTVVIGLKRAVQHWAKFAELERRAIALNRSGRTRRQDCTTRLRSAAGSKLTNG